MKLPVYGLLVIAAFVTCFLASTSILAQNAYIANELSQDVSVIDTATNKVTATIPVGGFPYGVAVAPDDCRVYVTTTPRGTRVPGNVTVIDTATNKTIALVKVGDVPRDVAVTPDGRKVYVANNGSADVSVIDTATNKATTVTGLVFKAYGVAVRPDGRRVYVTNAAASDFLSAVSVIDTTTHAVITEIKLGRGQTPLGVAVTPDGRKVYVANNGSNDVSVIDTATNKVTATIAVGSHPVAFGMFIQPSAARIKSPPSFPGTPGFSNCVGQSIAALDRQFGGRNTAAAALGFPDMRTMENAVLAFCR